MNASVVHEVDDVHNVHVIPVRTLFRQDATHLVYVKHIKVHVHAASSLPQAHQAQLLLQNESILEAFFVTKESLM